MHRWFRRMWIHRMYFRMQMRCKRTPTFVMRTWLFHPWLRRWTNKLPPSARSGRRPSPDRTHWRLLMSLTKKSQKYLSSVGIRKDRAAVGVACKWLKRAQIRSSWLKKYPQTKAAVERGVAQTTTRRNVPDRDSVSSVINNIKLYLHIRQTLDVDTTFQGGFAKLVQ